MALWLYKWLERGWSIFSKSDKQHNQLCGASQRSEDYKRAKARKKRK